MTSRCIHAKSWTKVNVTSGRLVSLVFRRLVYQSLSQKNIIDTENNKNKVCKGPLHWQTSLFPSNHRQLVSDASQSIQHGVQRLPAQLHRHRRRISTCWRVVHLER